VIVIKVKEITSILMPPLRRRVSSRIFSVHMPLPCTFASVFVLGALAGSLAPPQVAFAQQLSDPTFEVASLKQSAGGRVFIGLKSPGTFSADNVSLRGLIMEAYGIRAFQISGGPAWTGSEKYDVTAKPGVNATQDKGITRESTTRELAEMDLMLRSLLAERFKLKVHRQIKDLPVYDLEVAGGGLKVRASACTPSDPTAPASPSSPDRPPANICGASRYGTNGLNKTLDWTGTTMADFTRWALPTITGRTVIDRTGYTGTFDIHLEWTPAEIQDVAAESGDPQKGEPSGPSIFTALPEQLGVVLKSGKGPVDALVIDHVEKPSSN
jgi:uncharacterized protein (TIGR03435 family)